MRRPAIAGLAAATGATLTTSHIPGTLGTIAWVAVAAVIGAIILTADGDGGDR